MKTLFFFYLLSVGVFGFGASRSTFLYSFNASELNTSKFEGSGSSSAQYLSIGFEIWETYQNYNNNSDGYHSWINLRSPVLETRNLSSSSNEPLGFYTIIGRYEPCILVNYYNFSIVQEIQNLPSNLTVKGKLDAIAEDTLITLLPYTENILDSHLVQFTTVQNGDQRFRTIKIAHYENKDLVIQLSATEHDHTHTISSRIKEVIFATGDQCIWTYNNSSEDRFVRVVPEDSGRSWNVTVPAKDIWFIDFVTISNRNNFQVDYLLVDRPEPVPTSPPSSTSSAYIPCLDFNLIVVLILSVLIFQK